MQHTLFDTGPARAFHESETQQQEALAILRHRKLTKVSFERDWKHDGSRLAPAIHILRNGWGFEIHGNGSTRDPYWLIDPFQSPARVKRTDELQAMYYETDHWKEVRERRWMHDNYRCVQCVESCKEAIQCHHITYRLFAERLDELQTLCITHHKMLHAACKLAFPQGFEVWQAERLLEVAAYPFPEWLLP